MPLLDQPGVLDALDRRLASLRVDTARRWGSMSAHEMVCHLSDSFRGMLGERHTSAAPSTALQRHLVRFIALHKPIPWPKGVPTRPEVDPHRLGTRPGAFAADRDALGVLMRRFVAPGVPYAAHPMFG